MNFQEFGMSVLEYAIANIPTLIALVFMHTNKFKKVEEQVKTIDFSLLKTKDNIVGTIENKVNNVLENVDKRFEKTIDRVDDFLKGVDEKVSSFKEELELYRIQNEHLVKENKVSHEIISLLVSKNENLVRDGVASLIVNKLSLSKEELERYPELISSDINFFASALKEQYHLLGEEKFKELITKTVGVLSE